MRKLLLVTLALLLAGCGKAVSVREDDLVVRGDQAVQARPSPDQLSRGLRITSTRIAVVTHGQASDPIWVVVKRGIEDARRRENVSVSYRAPETFDIASPRFSFTQNAAETIARREQGIPLRSPFSRPSRRQAAPRPATLEKR